MRYSWLFMKLDQHVESLIQTFDTWLIPSCWPSLRGGNHMSLLCLVSSIFPCPFSNNWQWLTFIACYYDFPPYTSTRNEPTTCIRSEGLPKSTPVIKSGWSEPSTNLHCDQKMWLTGAATATKIVLILKWSWSYCSLLCRVLDYSNDWTASFQVLFSWLLTKVHYNEQPAHSSQDIYEGIELFEVE